MYIVVSDLNSCSLRVFVVPAILHDVGMRCFQLVHPDITASTVPRNVNAAMGVTRLAANVRVLPVLMDLPAINVSRLVFCLSPSLFGVSYLVLL